MNEQVSLMADRITETFISTFAALIERRDSRYAAAIAPLDAEQAQLRQECADIGEASKNLESVLPAKQRMARFEADRLTLEGKHAEAAVKLAEAEEAANTPATMSARQHEIAARLEAIDAEKRTIARRVFEEWYAECQAVVRPAEHALFVTLLNGIEDSMIDFQTRTGTASPNGLTGGLFHKGHIAGLTADERTIEWGAGQKWYAGRR